MSSKILRVAVIGGDGTGPEVAAEGVKVLKVKYEGYIKQQEREIRQIRRIDRFQIPRNTDFKRVSGLTREAIEKMQVLRPSTMGEAKKIPGMTPAAVMNLYIFLNLEKKRRKIANVPRETSRS